MNPSQFAEKINRQAIVMEVGGFRPPESDHSSWFGDVRCALPGEQWPRHDGKPMTALCQVNVAELPHRPPRLDDVEMLSVFVASDVLPRGGPNGDRWCLRTYSSLQQLERLEHPPPAGPLKVLPMRPTTVSADYPSREDVPIEIPPELDDDYSDRFETRQGFKLGGWPHLVQSEIFWAPWNRHPASPEYVFQIDSCDKANWGWGDSGVGYFGRGTTPGKLNEWALAWQCY